MNLHVTDGVDFVWPGDRSSDADAEGAAKGTTTVSVIF
jgi:hypothetical protein